MGSGYSFIKQMGGVLREEGRQMMDILIPRECLVCGKKLHKSEKYLCIYCESDLPLTYYWERRNNPMSSKLNGIIQNHPEKSDRQLPGKREHPHGEIFLRYCSFLLSR